MSDPKGSQLEGWITLTALPQKTQHVRVGTLVTGITYREPSVLVKMGATLDVITAGRLEGHCRAIGREVNSIEKSVGIPLVLTRDSSKLDAMLADMASRRAMSLEDARAGMLWGSPDQVINKIEAYREVGVTQIILSQRAPYDAGQLELFASEVVPALRETAPARR